MPQNFCPPKISSYNVFPSGVFFFPQKALDVIQIRQEDQELVFKLLAAILWLGNISFKVTDNESHAEVVDDEGTLNSLEVQGLNHAF